MHQRRVVPVAPPAGMQLYERRRSVGGFATIVLFGVVALYATWTFLMRNTPYTNGISEHQQPFPLVAQPPQMTLSLLLYDTVCSVLIADDDLQIPAKLCTLSTPIPSCLIMWQTAIANRITSFVVSTANSNITFPTDMLLFADGYGRSELANLVPNGDEWPPQSCRDLNAQKYSDFTRASSVERFVFGSSQLNCGTSCMAGSFAPTAQQN